MSATPCHDAQVVWPYRVPNPFRLTVLAVQSEDYTTVPQHLQKILKSLQLDAIASISTSKEDVIRKA